MKEETQIPPLRFASVGMTSCFGIEDGFAVIVNPTLRFAKDGALQHTVPRIRRSNSIPLKPTVGLNGPHSTCDVEKRQRVAVVVAR